MIGNAEETTSSNLTEESDYDAIGSPIATNNKTKLPDGEVLPQGGSIYTYDQSPWLQITLVTITPLTLMHDF